jgi:hypothetical protein
MWLTLGRFSPRSNYWYFLSSIEPHDTERLVELPELAETRSFRPPVFERMTGIRLRKGESIRVRISVELLGAAKKPRRRNAPPDQPAVESSFAPR